MSCPLMLFTHLLAQSVCLACVIVDSRDPFFRVLSSQAAASLGVQSFCRILLSDSCKLRPFVADPPRCCCVSGVLWELSTLIASLLVLQKILDRPTPFISIWHAPLWPRTCP